MAMRGPKLCKRHFLSYDDAILPDYWWAYPHFYPHGLCWRTVASKRPIEVSDIGQEFQDPRPDDDNSADWFELVK